MVKSIRGVGHETQLFWRERSWRRDGRADGKMKARGRSGRPAADTRATRTASRPNAGLCRHQPGKVVVDMLPGGGYFTRIFAKAVGQWPVYAYFGTQYDARLKSQGKDPDNQFADLKRPTRIWA